MFHARPSGCARPAAALLFVALAAAPFADRAFAQSRLEADYSIKAARIPIGSITATVETADDQYAMSMSGRASGALRILSASEGTFNARGTLVNGKPLPSEFAAKTKSDDDTLDVKMTFQDGSVKELTASAPPPSNDRVPLTETHRQNVLDPLTALLVPGPDSGELLAAAACQRTLAVFDGRRRFDLKLVFKRMDKVKAEKGYAGPVAVCAVTFLPIAGHRASSPLLKFLTEGREMEIALAPIEGTRLLAPFQILVVSMVGNLAITATRFEMLPPVRASAAPSP